MVSGYIKILKKEAYCSKRVGQAKQSSKMQGSSATALTIPAALDSAPGSQGLHSDDPVYFRQKGTDANTDQYTPEKIRLERLNITDMNDLMNLSRNPECRLCSRKSLFIYQEDLSAF